MGDKKRKPRKFDGYVWVKTSDDDLELIEAIADTAMELADICGVDECTVRSAYSRHIRKGVGSCYKKVYIGDSE